MVRTLAGGIGLGRSAPNQPHGKLRRQIILGVSGTGSFVLLQWLTVIALARLTSPEVVGDYALALAVTSPVVLATNLQLRNVVATDADRLLGFRECTVIRLATVPIDLAIVGLVLALGPWSGSQNLMIAVVLLTKEADSASDLCYGYLLRHDRTDLMAKSLFIRAAGAFVLTLTGTVLFDSVIAGLLLVIPFWLGVLVLLDMPAARGTVGPLVTRQPARRWRLAIDRSVARRILHLGTPLGGAALAVSFSSTFPRLVLERTTGSAALGVFAAITYLVQAGSTVLNAAAQAVLPVWARFAASAQHRSLRISVAQLTAIALTLGGGLVAASLLAGGRLLAVVYGDDYRAFDSEFQLLAVAGLATYAATIGNWAVTAMRAVVFQLGTALATTVCIVTLSLLVIPDHEVGGAALVIFSGMTVQAALSMGRVWQGTRARIGPAERMLTV